MIHALSLVGALTLATGDTVPVAPAGPRDVPVGVARALEVDTIPRRKRGKTVQISEAYETRLRIHRIASYTTIPLFAAQAFVGVQLYNADQHGTKISDAWRVTHNVIGGSIGALFAVNTVTGSLNWWDMRYRPEGRAWRTLHAAFMLAADGGLAYAATMGQGSRFTERDRTRHKNWAIGSTVVALTGYALMLSPIRRD